MGNSGFAYSNTLERVYLPETIESIGDEAFYGNYQLMLVNMPILSKLNTLGENIFNSCFDNFKINAYRNSLTNAYTYPELRFDFNNLTYMPKGFLSSAQYLESIWFDKVENIIKLEDDCFNCVGNKLPSLSNLSEFNYDEDNFDSSTFKRYFILKGNYEYIGKRAFRNSTMPILINSNFVIENIDMQAFSGAQILFDKVKNNDEILVFNGITFENGVFASAIINGSIKVTDCTLPENSTLFSNAKIYGHIVVELKSEAPENATIDMFNSAYVEGNLTLNLNNNTLGVNSLYNANVNGDVTINFINKGGKLDRKSLSYTRCNKLELIGVGEIDRAFSDEYIKNNIKAPKSIIFDETCTLTTINQYQFATCTGVEEIVLCSSITKIHGEAFAYTWNKRIDETSNTITITDSIGEDSVKVIIKYTLDPIDIDGNYFTRITTDNDYSGDNINKLAFYVAYDETIYNKYSVSDDWNWASLELEDNENGMFIKITPKP